MFSGLMKNETLEVIKIADNPFGAEGVTDLLGFLKLNKSRSFKEVTVSF